MPAAAFDPSHLHAMAGRTENKHLAMTLNVMFVGFLALMLYKELKKDLKDIKATTMAAGERHERHWQERETARRHDREEHRMR